MCSRPVSIDGQEFMCRKCNECITSRKNNWVARAMAEKATSEETFSVTLTYDDSTEENRDAARTFEYRHVSNWLKRLRRAIDYKQNKRGALRYIVAGERGSDKGRCHWHVILFANADVLTLGEMKAWPSGKLVTNRDDKITEGKRKRRLNWSLWPHGFITFQDPDQWGMEYALAYALKDQFNIVSAEGTMREAHVSRTSAGMFRMSKLPPIGYPYVSARCDKIDETGQLPINTNIRIPDYKGWYYPAGQMRDYYLERLRISNQIHIAKHGRDAPQWATLIHSVIESDKDWERLIHGEEHEEEIIEEEQEWQRSILLRTRESRAEHDARTTRRRCGGLAPCERCVNGLTAEGYTLAKAYARRWTREAGSFDAADKIHRAKNICNPYCGYRELSATKRVFKK